MVVVVADQCAAVCARTCCHGLPVATLRQRPPSPARSAFLPRLQVRVKGFKMFQVSGLFCQAIASPKALKFD